MAGNDDALLAQAPAEYNDWEKRVWRRGYLAARADKVDGASLIAAERQRQITAEGWTPEHDDEHGDGELVQAAACYALPPHYRVFDEDASAPQDWPWDAEWWKPGDRIRELVKAGALIAAEIDRLRRASGDQP